MLGLPKTTELNKQLPKKTIYTKFNMSTATKEKFDSNIAKMVIVNEISPNTIKSVSASEGTPAFYVLQVQLKDKHFDEKVIEQISKLINQKMLMILEHGNECKLVVYQTKLLESHWQSIDDCRIKLQGLDMGSIWQNVVTQVGGFEVSEGLTLDEQIKYDEKNSKIQMEIDKLEKQARQEMQPKKKFELVEKIQLLRNSKTERVIGKDK